MWNIYSNNDCIVIATDNSGQKIVPIVDWKSWSLNIQSFQGWTNMPTQIALHYWLWLLCSNI